MEMRPLEVRLEDLQRRDLSCMNGEIMIEWLNNCNGRPFVILQKKQLHSDVNCCQRSSGRFLPGSKSHLPLAQMVGHDGGVLERWGACKRSWSQGVDLSTYIKSAERPCVPCFYTAPVLRLAARAAQGRSYGAAAPRKRALHGSTSSTVYVATY